VSLVPVGDLLLVELRPAGLRALLTRDSAGALALAPDAPVTAIIKATSLVCVGKG
jgi:molybdopterin-binding protein